MNVRLNILLRGFTTIELMISLLLMSVVVNLMASLYLNIRSSQRIIENVNEDFSECCRLYSVLGKDVSDCDSIGLNEEEKLVLSTKKGKVVYLPLGEKTVRQKNCLIDTIDVEIVDINILSERDILEVNLRFGEKQLESFRFEIPKKEASAYINSNLLK